jgi:hypothetical protein
MTYHAVIILSAQERAGKVEKLLRSSIFLSVKIVSCNQCRVFIFNCCVFRGKILTGGYVMKILSDNPPRIMASYITHVDLQGT